MIKSKEHRRLEREHWHALDNYEAALSSINRKDIEIEQLRDEIDETWNEAIQAAADELQHHLTTEEDETLLQVWQERILNLKKE